MHQPKMTMKTATKTRDPSKVTLVKTKVKAASITM